MDLRQLDFRYLHTLQLRTLGASNNPATGRGNIDTGHRFVVALQFVL